MHVYAVSNWRGEGDDDDMTIGLASGEAMRQSPKDLLAWWRPDQTWTSCWSCVGLAVRSSRIKS